MFFTHAKASLNDRNVRDNTQYNKYAVISTGVGSHVYPTSALMIAQNPFLSWLAWSQMSHEGVFYGSGGKRLGEKGRGGGIMYLT